VFALDVLKDGWRLIFFCLIRTSEQRPRPHTFNILAYVPPDWRDRDGYSNLRDFMHVPVSCALAMAEEQSDQVYNALNRISLCQDN
jgi:hypothetical protein